MDKLNIAYCSDKYQYTMGKSYLECGKDKEIATFNLFYRKAPENNNWAVVSGTEEIIEMVQKLGSEPEEFYVLEQVKLGGKMYLLVTDEEEGDGMALILRDDAEEGSDESLYAVVEDDNELSAALLLFSDKLEEMGILIEE